MLDITGLKGDTCEVKVALESLWNQALIIVQAHDNSVLPDLLSFHSLLINNYLTC